MELEIRSLSKNYGDLKALNNFTVTFKEGIYGILGPNGAGKSTLMNLITDNIKRDSGQILFNEKEVLDMGEDFRKIVGYMPQQQGFYEHFTAKAFLMYMASLKGLKKKEAKEQIEDILETVNLKEVSHKKIGGFSGGMRQRVLLAQALLGDPKIIILDEPTAGLDPKERIRIRNFISKISKDKIILYATHVVSDIESIADRVLLINSGTPICEETPIGLIDTLKGKVAEVSCSKDQIEELQETFTAGNITQKREGLFLRIVGDNLPAEFTRVEDNINLEDVYLYYFKIK